MLVDDMIVDALRLRDRALQRLGDEPGDGLPHRRRNTRC